MTKLKVCFTSSELAPFAKTGGLADVSSALSRYLHRTGHDIRIFLPLYGSIETNDADFQPVEFLQKIPIGIGGRTFEFSVHTAALPETDLMVYFIHCPALYDRPGLYTSDPDEHQRFVLLSRATLESCQRMGWSPDIIHCNDWQTALVPLYLKTVYGWDQVFSRTRTILTIHNIGYQGTFASGILGDLGLGNAVDRLHQEDLHHGVINLLKTGILYADLLTTVSPTYAREIQTEEFGMGLEQTLRARSGSLVGVLNGVDYEEWSPEADPNIPHTFSLDDLSGKEKNKQVLLRSLGLPYSATVPTVGIVSRLTGQKGFELLQQALPEILRRREMRLVVLGSGDSGIEDFFRWLHRVFPTKVSFYNGFSNELAHLIEAGSDMFLMPSRYEPCGLNQMYSLRYGTVPIVRKTGGLADSVQIYDPDTGEGTGIVFEHYTSEALAWALNTALDLFGDPKTWRRIMSNGMSKDFSWEKQGAHYVRLYENLIGK